MTVFWLITAVGFALSAAVILRMRRSAAQLHRLDRLTGALNRVGLLEEISLAQRRDGAAGLLLLDVDHFTSINDSLGDRSGDEFLSVTAARIRAAAHAHDSVARLEGDTFAVLCRSSSDLTEATGCATRVAAAVGVEARLPAGPVRRSVSIGVALVAGDASSAAEMLRRAQQMLGQAKSSGGGRIVAYDVPAEAAELLRRTVGADLPNALASREVRVAYQPIVSLRDGALAHVEALVRWRHPTLGDIPPERLVGIAEETGATDLLGRYVLHCATQTIAAWNKTHASRLPLSVAVNIAPQQLVRGQLLGDVFDALQTSGLDGSLLVLELVESAVIDSSPDVLLLLGRLQRLGVRLAMDDYGTGYSSLTNLIRLPLDILKIDRSFVSRLGDEHEDVMVAAVSAIGRVRDLTTVAEGVETAEELAHVIRLDVDLAQGYLFAKALELQELDELIFQAPRWSEAVTRARTAAALLDAAPSVVRAVTRRQLPALRVLILDDNPDDVALYTSLLRHAGHDVVGLSDPTAFPAAMISHQPDVVLMDLRLSSSRTGADVLAEMRERGDRNTPVIAVTGYPEWSTRMLLGPTGFAGVIQKPIDVQGFVTEVTAYLRGYGDGSAATVAPAACCGSTTPSSPSACSCEP